MAQLPVVTAEMARSHRLRAHHLAAPLPPGRIRIQTRCSEGNRRTGRPGTLNRWHPSLMATAPHGAVFVIACNVAV